MDAIHFKGMYLTPQNDDQPLDVNQFILYTEENTNVGFLTEDIPRRLAENWATNKIEPGTVFTIYRRNFLLENKFEFYNCVGEDRIFQLAAMCLAKKYFLAKDLLFYVHRLTPNSLTRKPNIKSCVESMAILSEQMTKILDKIPELEGNRLFKEQCIIPSFDVIFKILAYPFYDGRDIPLELENLVYEALLPIFGEKTMIVKYFFHGFHVKHRQAEIFVELLNQRENSFQRQTQLIGQMKNLLNQYDSNN